MTTDNEQTEVTAAKGKVGRPPNRAKREEIHPEELNITYNESVLALPEELVDRFRAEGFELRWIRYRIGEKEDYSNISKKAKHGWHFVTEEEVPELGANTLIQDCGRQTGLVTIEDLALAKCPTVHVKKLRMLKAKVAAQQMKAEEEKLGKYKDIRKSYKTRITKGSRQPIFDTDDEDDA